jgi:DNA-binding NarL/FixJ family response regulator
LHLLAAGGPTVLMVEILCGLIAETTIARAGTCWPTDEVAASVGDALELVEVERERPDICIVDVRMPPTFTDEGLRAAIEIRSRWPDTPVLVLSQYVEERYAVDLLSGQTSGVGYLLKQRVADVRDFLDALERVANGGTALDPEVVAQLLARARRHPHDELTPREHEVLGLMAEGL